MSVRIRLLKGEESMNMNLKLLALGVATAGFWSGMALSSEAPSYVRIGDISHGGSGCPQGSVGKSVAHDGKSFTLLFDEFFVEVGNGALPSDRRKNCQVNINVEFPQGWSYSVIGFDYRGYASLDHRVKGIQETSYYFQGEEETKTFKTSLNGELDKDYLISDEIDADAIVWSECGANKSLNINSKIWLNNRRNRNGSGLLTVDSLDGTVNQKYHLRWKKCPSSPTQPPSGGGNPTIPGNDAPSSLSIRYINTGGSGCPQGSVAKSIASDNKSFTLIYDDFVAESGPGISRRENRKFCQATVDFDYPEGWTYTLVSLDYRGFADIEAGVTGVQYLQILCNRD